MAFQPEVQSNALVCRSECETPGRCNGRELADEATGGGAAVRACDRGVVGQPSVPPRVVQFD